jgi:putative heme-binding domain-containing protein
MRGSVQVAKCYICHAMGGKGIRFGPDLSEWGRPRTIEQIVEDIVHPSKRMAPGFESSVRVTRDQHVAEGIASNYMVHGPGSEFGGSLRLKVFGGQSHKIFFRRGGAKIDLLKNHSWMPPPSKLGLSDQDVRDIAEYLKNL